MNIPSTKPPKLVASPSDHVSLHPKGRIKLGHSTWVPHDIYSIHVAGAWNPVYNHPLKWFRKWWFPTNHFLYTDLVHHPIDSQPSINGWPWGSKGWLWTTWISLKLAPRDFSPTSSPNITPWHKKTPCMPFVDSTGWSMQAKTFHRA